MTEVVHFPLSEKALIALVLVCFNEFVSIEHDTVHFGDCSAL